MLKAGDTVPEFTLPNTGGTLVDSKRLLEKGPLVVTFFRGRWCPYCNVDLAALQRVLPDITAAGATLVVISLQIFPTPRDGEAAR